MELKKEDLINECEKCGGTGWFKETSGARTTEGGCQECGGAGATLTDSGLAIAEVIRILKKRGQI